MFEFIFKAILYIIIYLIYYINITIQGVTGLETRKLLDLRSWNLSGSLEVGL